MNNSHINPPGAAAPPPPPKAGSVPPPPPRAGTVQPPPPAGSLQATTQPPSDALNEKLQGLKPYWQNELRKIHESNGKYKGKFNFAAACFTFWWAFSKGLIVHALLSLFIWAIIVGALPNEILIPASILYFIYYGTRGNKLVYEKIVLGKEPIF